MNNFFETAIDYEPDFIAERLTELPLRVMIPLLADYIEQNEGSNSQLPQELLECCLVRWERLTGKPHSIDEALPRLCGST